MAEVRVDGRWLAEFGHVGELRWSSRWGDGPCGSSQASCALTLAYRDSPSVLIPGRKAEVVHMGRAVWTGFLSEPTRGPVWSLNFYGAGQEAANFTALTSGGAPTTVPADAVAAAITRGWRVTNGGGWSTAAFGGAATVAINRLDSLLNESTKTAGQRWGVHSWGTTFVTTDPTTPTYVLDARDVEVGVADDNLYTRVLARYVSAMSGTPSEPSAWSTSVADDTAAQARYGVREFVLDLTPLGLISSGTAASYAAQQLAQLTVPAWVNRLTVNRLALTNMGGIPADLASVKAGEMVRLHGVNDGLGRLRNELSLDVVLGEVEYEEGSSEITLAPLNLAPRTLADVLADMGSNTPDVAA